MLTTPAVKINKNWSKCKRVSPESFWMKKLQTTSPDGINEKNNPFLCLGLRLVQHYMLFINTPYYYILTFLNCFPQLFLNLILIKRAARARALLELLTRRGPKPFDEFCQTFMVLKRDDLVSVLAHSEDDMEICYPQYSNFNIGAGVHLEVDGGIVQLIQDPVTVNFPLGRCKVFENNVGEISSVVECMKNNRFRYTSEHLGANDYVMTGNDSGCVDIRCHWISPTTTLDTPVSMESV